MDDDCSKCAIMLSKMVVISIANKLLKLSCECGYQRCELRHFHSSSTQSTTKSTMETELREILGLIVRWLTSVATHVHRLCELGTR